MKTILLADPLQMYFRYPYTINVESARGEITLYQPTIGDVVAMGTKKFDPTLNVFTTNSTMNRALLWDLGIDWNEINDFQMFQMLFKTIDSEAAKLFLGELDFSNFDLYQKNTGEISLYSEEDDIEINEEVFNQMCAYLRTIFNRFPEDEYTKDKMLKRWWVDKDKRELARKKDKPEENSSILPIISACINHPGFKYNLEQLKDVGVYQFWDSVQRLQIYESATAIMRGMYSGFVDAKKIDPDAYNFMKKI